MRVNFWIPRPVVLFLIALATIFFAGPAVYQWATGDYWSAIGNTLPVVFFAALFMEILTKPKRLR